MAQTEHLPIYKKAYDLCLYVEQAVRNFPRYHKYTLGTDLRDGARRVLRLIVRANARRDKAPTLLEIREELEQLKAVLRLGQDVQAFSSFKSFEHAIGRFVEFRGPQRPLAERVLGLRRAYLPRAGYAFAVGFPVWLAGFYALRAVGRGLTVVDVRERPAPGGVGCRPRVPAAVLVPATRPCLAFGCASRGSALDGILRRAHRSASSRIPTGLNPGSFPDAAHAK